jgi:hypothetical protein
MKSLIKTILPSLIVGLFSGELIFGATILFPSGGGTGIDSYNRGDLIMATSTSLLYRLATGTEGHYLKISSGIPSWAAVSYTETDPIWQASSTDYLKTATAASTYLATGTAALTYLATGTASSTYVHRNDWATIDNYPADCASGGVVYGLGDALSCHSTSTQRTNLGLVIGTNVQAQSTYLQTISAMSPTAGSLLIGAGVDGDFHQVEAFTDYTGYLRYNYGGNNTSTALQLGYLFMGNGDGTMVQVASNTLASALGVSSLNTLTGGLTLWGTSPLTLSASGTDGLLLAVTDVATSGTPIATFPGTTTISHTDLNPGRSISTSTAGTLDADYELYSGSFSFDISRATTTQNYGQNQHALPFAATITEIECFAATTTNSNFTFQIDERASTTPNTAGTDIMLGSLTCASTTNSTTSFANASIGAKAKMNLDIDSVSVTPLYGRITVYFTKDD